MSKEAFISAHEQLIAEYQELHPEADWTEAYEKTADLAHERSIDNLADLADELKDRAKYERKP